MTATETPEPAVPLILPADESAAVKAVAAALYRAKVAALIQKHVGPFYGSEDLAYEICALAREPEAPPATSRPVAAALRRAKAAEAKLANLRSLAEGCWELASNGRDLDRNCTASAAYRAVAGDMLAIIGGEEERFTVDRGKPSAADRTMVARATGGGIRSGEVQPAFDDQEPSDA